MRVFVVRKGREEGLHKGWAGPARAAGSRVSRRGAAAIASAAIAASATFAPAASNVYTWNNSGTDFNTPSDWNFNGGVSAVYPGTAGGGANNDVADFNTLGTQPNVSANDTLGELEFDTSGWTLSGTGNVLTLNGGTVDATNANLNVGILSAPTSGTNTIGVGLDIGAAQTWEIGTGGTLNVTGPVTDTNALTIGATGFTGAVSFTQAITYGGELTAAGSSVTFSNGWAPASPYAGVALQVTNGGAVTFAGGTTSITTNNVNTAPGGYILDNVSGTTTVNSGAMLNLSVTADLNGGANEHVYVYNGPGATITNNGTLNVTGRPAFLLDANSTINDNGAMSFGPFTGATAGFLLLQMGNGAAINVGSAANGAANSGASLIVSEPAGMVVENLGTGTSVGSINVYGTFSANASSPASPGSPLLRLGTDTVGAQDILTVYSAANGGAPGNVTLNSVALGDNGTSSAVAGILGAIYLQSGTKLNFVSTAAGNGVFSIGAAGAAPPSSTTGGGGQNNDFGYVFVGSGASIGAISAPGQIDIGGQLRGSAAVGGGNGVMDVMGGAVTVGTRVGLSDSNFDQQFSALNLVGGSTLTLKAGNGTGSILTLAGTSAGATAGIYGSYSVVNVIDSTVAMTGTNNAINVAGSSGGSTGVNPHQTYLLPTGILNIVGSSVVNTGYVRGGSISVGGTPNANGTTPPTVIVPDGTASGFVNFNGGTLNDVGGSATFMFQSVAGYYIYNGGATISGPGNSSSILSTVGFSAPPGQGIPLGTISGASITGGSGYVAPPVVLISDPTGFDASGYATVSNGQVTGIVITNPGFNMSNPTIQLVGGGGAGASVTLPALVSNASGPLTVNANSGTTFTLTGGFAGSNGNNGSGSSFPAGIYSIANTNGSDNYNVTGTSNSLIADTSGNELGNNPYANGRFYGFTNPGIRNNTSTYTGPTVIQSGTLALVAPVSSATAGNPNNYAAGAFAATNNNIPFSSAIIVGDVAANKAAVLNITGVAGSGGFQLAPGLINSSTYNNTTYTYASNPQVLAGFGTVRGSSTVGLTIGLASGGVTASTTGTTSTGNNFGGYPYVKTGTFTSAPTVNNSAISPGYTASGSVVPMGTSMFVQDNTYGPIVIGTTTSAPPTYTFNTQQGNAAKPGQPSTAVGALTVGGGSSTTTTFGAGGVYYWKLDLTNGGAGAATTPGIAAAAAAPYVGTAWDNLILDNLAISSTASGSNAFTIQAVSFNSAIPLMGGSSIPLSGNTMPSSSYSWVIAQVPAAKLSVTGLQTLLADFSLNATGLPAPANGYQYFLSAQVDPLVSNTDLVVNYAPTPEPTGLALFGLGAGAMLVRRRRTRGAV